MEGNLAKKAKTGPPDEEQDSAMDEAGGMEAAVKAEVNAAVAAAEKKKDLEREEAVKEAEKKKDLEREEAVKDASSESIRALLEFEESSDITFACRGLRNSHTSTKHARANISHGCKFELCAVKPPFLVDAALKRSSKVMQDLMTAKRCFKSIISFRNEADVGGQISSGIDDALVIVNEKLNEIIGKKLKLLSFRESGLSINNLSTSRTDFMLVIDATSGAPVCIIEVKQPGEEVALSKTVAGQLRDYLEAMHAFGHPNPFAVLTTFETSWVAWCPDIGDSDAIAEEEHRFERVDEILEDLPGESEAITPLPQKTYTPQAPRDTADNRHRTRSRTRNSNNNCKPLFEPSRTARRVSYSEPYSLHQLVPLLCNVIMCGLKNFSKNRRPLIHFEANASDEKTESRRVLKFSPNEKGISLGTLIGRVHGEAPKSPSFWGRLRKRIKNLHKSSFEDFYIIDFIAAGSTSKVFQAVSLDGHLCVIKMYVKRFNGNNLLKLSEFTKNAEASVNHEVRMYHLIYPELKDHVWCQTLNDCECVIMPFFSPIPIKDREASLENIRTVLTKKFEKHRRRFAESDQRWRHIGKYNGDFYLFDLADLLESAEKGDFVEAHVAALEKRHRRTQAAEPSTPSRGAAAL